MLHGTPIQQHISNAKNAKENDINYDITAKWMILSTLGEKSQEIVKGNEKTTYQFWKLQEKSFTKSNESRKLELKKKLNELKFEEEQDINIFMRIYKTLLKN